MKKNNIHTAADGGSDKTKLISYSHIMMVAAITIFSLIFLVGLSVVGTVNVAASSRAMPQLCDGGSGINGSNSTATDGANNTNTTTTTTAAAATGIAGTANNSMTGSLYQNTDYGIQILCPEDWAYIEEENPFTGSFRVFFLSIADAFEIGAAQESGVTPEMFRGVGVTIDELPFRNIDLQRFADLNIRDLTSSGYEIVSSNLNATLS